MGWLLGGLRWSAKGAWHRCELAVSRAWLAPLPASPSPPPLSQLPSATERRPSLSLPIRHDGPFRHLSIFNYPSYWLSNYSVIHLGLIVLSSGWRICGLPRVGVFEEHIIDVFIELKRSQREGTLSNAGKDEKQKSVGIWQISLWLFARFCWQIGSQMLAGVHLLICSWNENKHILGPCDFIFIAAWSSEGRTHLAPFCVRK